MSTVFIALQTNEETRPIIEAIEQRAPDAQAPVAALHEALADLAAAQGQRGSHRATLPAPQVQVQGRVAQPVGPVDLVLVEQVGQAARQLPQTIRVARAQKTRHGSESGRAQQPGQQAHQAPGERCLVHQRLRRHLGPAQHLAVGTPEEARGQLDACGRADASLLRQRHLEPLGHSIALHQHHLLFQRRQRMLVQPGHHGIGQALGAVAVQRDQAVLERGEDDRGFSHRCGLYRSYWTIGHIRYGNLAWPRCRVHRSRRLGRHISRHKAKRPTEVGLEDKLRA